MKTEFSFKYDGELKKFKCEGEYAIDRGLKVRVQKIDYPEFDASYQMIWFCNESDENSKIISDIYDCDTLMPFKEMPLRPGFEPESGNICVTTMKGMVPGYLYWDDNMTSAEEYSLHDEYLSKRKSRVICNSYGRSSAGMMPFFNLHQGNRGAMIAIGWTGSWRAEFAAGDEGVSVKTGLKNTHFYLKPGENILEHARSRAGSRDKFNFAVHLGRIGIGDGLVFSFFIEHDDAPGRSCRSYDIHPRKALTEAFYLLAYLFHGRASFLNLSNILLVKHSVYG